MKTTLQARIEKCRGSARFSQEVQELLLRECELAEEKLSAQESELTKLRKRVEVLEKALEKYALPQTRLTKKHEEEQWRLEPGFHDPQTAVEALKESAKIAGE